MLSKPIISTCIDHVLGYYTICVDPTLKISTSAVDIERDQQSLSLFCIPSSSYLPVTWREGNHRLTSNDSRIMLSPPSLHHNLSIDLTSHNLTGQSIVCEVKDPEGLREVVASATIRVFLPSGMLYVYICTVCL